MSYFTNCLNSNEGGYEVSVPGHGMDVRTDLDTCVVPLWTCEWSAF